MIVTEGARALVSKQNQRYDGGTEDSPDVKDVYTVQRGMYIVRGI
jgi:hypothetical protein